jgi:hypothetical protein
MTLTTITPVWNRPDALKVWIKAIRAAACYEVNHLLIFVDERAPREIADFTDLWVVEVVGKEHSIGHWHNIGARMLTSDWIMKLDVDTIPNPRYFKELLPILVWAAPREWFNGGMLYLNRKSSALLETKDLTERNYTEIIENPGFYSANSYLRPAGTNFICRRQEYLDLGGCDERFRGYGWEDYQQIYMLERHQRGANPLPGRVDLLNVTWRCRDDISRAKAWELFQKNKWLCLLHKWHARSPYRSAMGDNRTLLLDYIQKCEKV